MYKNNIVVSIKCNGKFLRETKEHEVFLPFGQEYSLFIKNMSSGKALIRVDIDGQDILNNKSLIVEENSILDLDCFVDDLNNNRKFKFIEKTDKISNYRGDRVEDGLVRIEVQFEKEKVELPQYVWNYPQIWSAPTYYYDTTYKSDPYNKYEITCRSVSASNVGGTLSCSNLSVNGNIVLDRSNINTQGITTKGSESNQQFTYGNIGPLENNKTVLVIKLSGIKSNNSEVKQPITTKSSIICEMCGVSNKSINNYCIECGTYLK